MAHSNLPRDILLTGLALFLWGTTCFVTTEWLPSGYPLFITMMRSLPVGVLLCLAFRQWPSRVWWWRSAVSGFLNIGLFFGLLFAAASCLPGGITATIGAIQPLIIIALAWGILKERRTIARLVLASLGAGGVVLLVLTPSAQLDPLSVLAGCGAIVPMAGGTVLTEMWGQPVHLLNFTAWQLVAGGVILLYVSLVYEDRLPTILAKSSSRMISA